MVERYHYSCAPVLCDEEKSVNTVEVHAGLVQYRACQECCTHIARRHGIRIACPAQRKATNPPGRRMAAFHSDQDWCVMLLVDMYFIGFWHAKHHSQRCTTACVA